MFYIKVTCKTEGNEEGMRFMIGRWILSCKMYKFHYNGMFRRISYYE